MQNAAKKQGILSCSFMTPLPGKRISTQDAQLRHAIHLCLCVAVVIFHMPTCLGGTFTATMAQEEKDGCQQTQTESSATTRTVRKEFYGGENLK